MTAPTEPKLTSAWDTIRHDGHGWPQFLSSVQIEGLRGWTGESVEFRYPVVAIAGVNGAGKSTVLKAAASAYTAPAGGSTSTFYPDDFFPNTPWEKVAGVVLTFTVRQGVTTDTIKIRKPTSRWRGAPDRKERSTYFLDVSRIQPANTQIGYGRLAQEVVSRGTANPLTDEQVAQLSRALGRTYEQARIDRNQDKQIGVLTQLGVNYSNFHQGAGEDTILDLLALIGEAPAKSLIIIDEVEASLHPQAQRGLITELLRLAHDKRLQIILSTHSPFILEQLPTIGRVFISLDRNSGRQVLYGVSPDFALNLMDDERHDELDLYCEDERAAYLIERILAVGAPEILNRVCITSVGPANTVMMLGSIVAAGKLSRRGFSIVDADQSPGADYLVLPGSQAPESEVMLSLSDANWTAVAERLGWPVGQLLDAKDSAILIPDHHAWPGEIARLIGGTMRPSKVWEAVADVWARDVLGAVAATAWSEPIVSALRN